MGPPGPPLQVNMGCRPFPSMLDGSRHVPLEKSQDGASWQPFFVYFLPVWMLVVWIQWIIVKPKAMKKYQEYTKNDQGFYFSLVGLMHGTSIVAAFRISEVPKIVSSNPTAPDVCSRLQQSDTPLGCRFIARCILQLLIGGFKHVLCSISYMGCHPNPID